MASLSGVYHHSGHRFLTSYDLTIFTSLLVGFYKVVALSIMAYLGVVSLNKFTYWNFTIDTCYYLCLFFVLWQFRCRAARCASTFYRYFIMLATPMVFGSSVIVFFLISFILYWNDDDFLESTKFGGGRHTVGEVHGADWFIHYLPVFDSMLVGFSGLLAIWRHAYRYTPEFSPFSRHIPILEYREGCSGRLTGVRTWRTSQHSGFAVFYFLWCLCSALIPIGIYCLFFNPLEEYPTGLPPVLAVLSMIIPSFIIGLFLWLFVMAAHTDQKEIFDNECFIVEKCDDDNDHFPIDDIYQRSV